MQLPEGSSWRGDTTDSTCVSAGNSVRWRKIDKTFPGLEIIIGLAEVSENL